MRLNYIEFLLCFKEIKPKKVLKEWGWLELYIPKFVCGFFAAILLEIVIAIIWDMYMKSKKRKKQK